MNKIGMVFVGYTAAGTHISVANCSTRITIRGGSFSPSFLQAVNIWFFGSD